MERKSEGMKRLSICCRLFTFFMENLHFHTFKQVTLGRVPSAKREESNSLMTTRKGLQYDKSVVEEEEELPLVPPTRAIPVEHRDSRKKKNRKAVRIESSSEDNKDKGMMPKIEPRDETFGRSKSLEKSRGTTKPVVRSVSNIDTKFDTFIRERKESFEKLS